MKQKVPKDYPWFWYRRGNALSGIWYWFQYIRYKKWTSRISTELDATLYDSNPNNLGLNNRLGLLGDYLKQVQKELKDLEEALQLQTEQMRVAKIEFQSTATELQEDIKKEKKWIYHC